MTAAFETVLHLSLRAVPVIFAVLLVRLCLQKAPRKYSFLLWAIVVMRLCLPLDVLFQSPLSLYNLRPVQTLTEQSQTLLEGPAVPDLPVPDAPVTAPSGDNIRTEGTIRPSAPITVQNGIGPMQAAAAVWLAVLGLLLGHGAVTYVRLRRRMASATRLEGRVFQSEQVGSPFILGFFSPRIYIPYGLGHGPLTDVLAHENQHIAHGDHLLRPFFWLVLCVHWFNPLVWLCYFLMGRDMEIRIDEAVLQLMPERSADYSATLLAFAAPRTFPSPISPCLGESDVGRRIRHILGWKQPALWLHILAGLLCAFAIVVCLSNALDKDEPTMVDTANAHLLEGLSFTYDDDLLKFLGRFHDLPEDFVQNNYEEYVIIETPVSPVLSYYGIYSLESKTLLREIIGDNLAFDRENVERIAYSVDNTVYGYDGQVYGRLELADGEFIDHIWFANDGTSLKITIRTFGDDRLVLLPMDGGQPTVSLYPHLETVFPECAELTDLTVLHSLDVWARAEASQMQELLTLLDELADMGLQEIHPTEVDLRGQAGEYSFRARLGDRTCDIHFVCTGKDKILFDLGDGDLRAYQVDTETEAYKAYIAQGQQKEPEYRISVLEEEICTTVDTSVQINDPMGSDTYIYPSKAAAELMLKSITRALADNSLYTGEQTPNYTIQIFMLDRMFTCDKTLGVFYVNADHSTVYRMEGFTGLGYDEYHEQVTSPDTPDQTNN